MSDALNMFDIIDIGVLHNDVFPPWKMFNVITTPMFAMIVMVKLLVCLEIYLELCPTGVSFRPTLFLLFFKMIYLCCEESISECMYQ